MPCIHLSEGIVKLTVSYIYSSGLPYILDAVHTSFRRQLSSLCLIYTVKVCRTHLMPCILLSGAIVKLTVSSDENILKTL